MRYSAALALLVTVFLATQLSSASPVSSSPSVADETIASFESNVDQPQIVLGDTEALTDDDARGRKGRKEIKNRIIMIRHGEKTKNKPGLSKSGKARAQCVRQARLLTLH